jgi:drug/metabolite transporter (DMT)-like permease
LILRLTISIVVLFIIYPKINKEMESKSEILFILSGASLAGYFIFENTALELTYSSNVGLLVALSPLFTAIIVSIKEKKSYFIPKNIIGLSLALFGVGLVVFGKEGIVGVNPLGDILAMSAALMFSFYTGFLSDVTKEYHIIQKTRKVFIYVLLTLLIYALITKESIVISTTKTSVLLGILYLGIMASSFAFIFWNKSIELIGTFKTNLFIYLVPAFTMIFSAIIFDDPVTLLKIIGAILILTGLYITERKKRLFLKKKLK